MMSQHQLEPLSRRGISLSFRISLGLVFAAVLPLILTVAFTEWQTRPQLLAQANTAMQSDAKTRVQLIDTYLNERLLDTQTLAQVPVVPQFLVVSAHLPPTSDQYQALLPHVIYALAAGIYRDKRYATWDLFDPNGQLRLYYPLNNKPKPHGNYFVSAEYLAAVRSGKTFISTVYYTPATNKASVDIYSPIYTQPTTPKEKPQYVGFMRATLNIDYIWNIVQNDLGSNGNGSYAFILDENGIRIADTNASRLFQAVAPISDTLQQQITQEQRYGTTNDVTVVTDNAFAAQLGSTATTATFQTRPASENQDFQVVRDTTTTTHWRYFVLSPVSTVLAVANQQFFLTILVAFGVAALTAIIGLIAGLGITRPILRSVNYLRENSQALSTLAIRQQDAASEQTWVVDSSQVGLQSVQYYTEATRVAAQRLNQVGTDLLQRWPYTNQQQVKQVVEKMVAAAQYIENASQYQGASNQKLSTALKVATQVTEQLAAGATSATDAATQMEQVVTQLRLVVGR